MRRQQVADFARQLLAAIRLGQQFDSRIEPEVDITLFRRATFRRLDGQRLRFTDERLSGPEHIVEQFEELLP